MKKLRKLKDQCAVVALCYASKVPEEVAIRMCTLHGYKAGIGMADEDWRSAAKSLGIKTCAVPMEHMRIHQFIKEHPTGLYLCWTVNHLFVVDHGKLIDPMHEPKPSVRRIMQGALHVRE